MPEPTIAGRLRAYIQLLRISNVLTAVADIWMGMVITVGSLEPLSVVVPLTIASISFYLSGMVLNDVFDVQTDRRDRPERPIPSGKVPRTSAAAFGAALWVLGLVWSALAAMMMVSAAPLVAGVLLGLAVLAYNATRKGHPARPMLMGACRGLNVMLGMSAAGSFTDLPGTVALPPGCLVIALAFVIYIAGLTLFARTEARTSRRGSLAFGMTLSLSALAILAMQPFLNLGGPGLLRVSDSAWLLLWMVVALLISRRFVAALLQPTPRHVQSAVGNGIQSIILIDAALAWGYAGQIGGLAILALLPLTMLLSKWIPQT